jgi:hypothetical protein
MEQSLELVTLSSLAGGAAVERFGFELARVLDNCADINTVAKKARTITLTVAIVPSADRSVAAITIDCTSKLAGLDTLEHNVHLVQDGRKQVAYQSKAKQMELPFSNVSPIDGKG